MDDIAEEMKAVVGEEQFSCKLTACDAFLMPVTEKWDLLLKVA